MKIDHDDEPVFKKAAGGTGLTLLIAGAIAVIGAVLYFGLGG